jgi:hypothetical protein
MRRITCYCNFFIGKLEKVFQFWNASTLLVPMLQTVAATARSQYSILTGNKHLRSHLSHY